MRQPPSSVRQLRGSNAERCSASRRTSQGVGQDRSGNSNRFGPLSWGDDYSWELTAERASPPRRTGGGLFRAGSSCPGSPSRVSRGSRRASHSARSMRSISYPIGWRTASSPSNRPSPALQIRRDSTVCVYRSISHSPVELYLRASVGHADRASGRPGRTGKPIPDSSRNCRSR
jgi:hypothetical protein